MILEEINRIKTAKADIKTAIEGKGVTVSSSAKIDNYASLIDDISIGGGSSKYGNLIDNYSGSTVTDFNLYALFEHLTIPSNIKTLWTNFPGYSQIKSISFEENSQCTSLPNSWFANVTALTNATLPPLITSIPSQCFYNTRFSTIDIPSGVTTINSHAFGDNTSLTTVNFQSNNTLTTIGDGVFKNCTSLSSITIPLSVTTIGNGVFEDCNSLTSINIPSGVTSINNYTFNRCRSLTSVVIPDSVTSIGLAAFMGCTSLTSIDIPSGVTSISSHSFRDCSSLTNVTVKAATPPTLNNTAFSNTNNCTIYVPAESVEAYKTATDWSNLASRIQAIPSE